MCGATDQSFFKLTSLENWCFWIAKEMETLHLFDLLNVKYIFIQKEWQEL